jgi:hypothetical protein
MVNIINIGLMEGNIKVVGEMENNTGRESSSMLLQMSGEKASGMMARESDGLLLIKNNFLF